MKKQLGVYTIIVCLCLILLGCNKSVSEKINQEEQEVLPTPTVAEETDDFMPQGFDVEGGDELWDGETYALLTSKRSQLILAGFTDMTLITSPVTIRGSVPSDWVFEGSFPITLLTDRGEIVKEWYGTADIFDEDGEIIEGNVVFESTIEFETPSPEEAETGKLRFASADPRQEVGDEDMVEVQVLFE